ncbi:MAG: T9SS type A sorting domain-containing protein [Bacteroidota bacterium]|nr:T9SS type A sorting domain-containing protein [Bacteroidota bacterium]
MNFPPPPPDNIEAKTLPKEFSLEQSYPNPFNPTATIRFDLPDDAIVTLKVYDMLGREVFAVLDKEELEAGQHEFEFVAEGLASGVYIYRIVSESKTKTFVDLKKMLLLK